MNEKFIEDKRSVLEKIKASKGDLAVTPTQLGDEIGRLAGLGSEQAKSTMVQIFEAYLELAIKEAPNIYAEQVAAYQRGDLAEKPKMEEPAETRLRVLDNLNFSAALVDAKKPGRNLLTIFSIAESRRAGKAQGPAQEFFMNTLGYHPDNVVKLPTKKPQG